ncbi:DNA recombination protein RmuC [Pseudomonas duriflava]|uniref:DNA recombination protein RmuC n=1 Tax=Pseudomonas duriflava TaxID=459528 RepID=A0A562QPN8_9PSED|nr:DNA recombination protein RmuC [Pseudomonas duriflava]TWI58643.1 DNA recombination protein RmuC [Pseudomonas duriflava]
MDSLTLFSLLLPLAALVGWGATAAWLVRQQQNLQTRLQEAQELIEAERSEAQRLEVAHSRQAVELDAERDRSDQLREQLEAFRQGEADLRQQARQAQQDMSDHRAAAEAAKAQLHGLQQQLQELRTQHERERQISREIQARHAQLVEEHATLRTTLEQKEQHFLEQSQLLRESREQLKLEFEQLAGQIFEAKGHTFSQHSQQSLDALLKPFREQIEAFRHKVEDIHHKDTQQQAALAQQLFDLKELNRQITQEAHELATALKGQKKTQGNWGELILENVLERSGLRLGTDFVREASFTTETGRRRPDVLVYLPQSKHLIIDAKVSLNAYTRYINSEDEAERRIALAEHVQAMGDRIRELSDREYFKLPGLNTPEMVFMFVPIESAFVEALKADETLFQRAIEQNVLVATPTTLLTSLNIVRQLWRFEDQSRHTAELADRASRVYDKLRTFLGSMDGIGKSLEKAQEAYHKACGQLMSGQGNLVKQVNDFKELGVAVKAEIEGQWTERAALELNLVSLDGERGHTASESAANS